MKTALMILLSLVVVGCSDITAPNLHPSTPHPAPVDTATVPVWP